MSVKAILTEQQKSYTKAEEDLLLATKQNTLTFDDLPTSGSVNPVKSDGIFKSRVPMNGMGKNLLDNWYFVGGGSQLGDGVFPINQRGQTQYSGSGKHFDRWGFGAAGGALELLASGVKITVTSGSQSFAQTLSMPNAALYGRTVTVSALTTGGDLYYETGTLPVSAPSSTTTYISKTIPNAGSLSVLYAASTSRFTVGIANSSSSSQSVTIAAMKLEFGTEQTLCHQANGAWVLNEIPDYGEELRKCQRYMIALTPMTDTYGFIGFALGNNNAALGADAIISLPTTMIKGSPTVSISGDWILYDRTVGTSLTITSMDYLRLTQNALCVIVKASGVVSGRMYEVMTDNDSTAKLIISCET